MRVRRFVQVVGVVSIAILTATVPSAAQVGMEALSGWEGELPSIMVADMWLSSPSSR